MTDQRPHADEPASPASTAGTAAAGGFTASSSRGAAGSQRQEVLELFELSAGLAHRTAHRLTGRGEDAEDIVQGVFLHLLEGPPMPWPDNPVAYVRRATVNASLDVLRRRKRWALRPAGDDNVPPVPGHEGSVLGEVASRELADRLRRALPLLSPLEAEVFALRAVDDLDNHEIAAVLGKTPNHVGVTLHAARRKLREAFAVEDAAAPPAHETDASDRRACTRSTSPGEER